MSKKKKKNLATKVPVANKDKNQNGNTVAGAGHSREEAEKRLRSMRKKSLTEYFKKALILFVGTIITAAGLEIFLIPNNIIDGGVVGISIMGSYLSGLPLGTFLVLLNLPFLYLGYKNIGMSFAVCTTFSIVSLSFWSELFEEVPMITEDFFLAAIFGGIITGTGVGLIIRNGGSLDGTEIVAIILDKKTSFSVGEIVMFFNLFILGSAGFIFGWDKSMYSLVAYFVIAKMIDVVIKGLDESYAVMLVSDKHIEIATELMQKLGRGVTYLSGEGAYTGNAKKVIYCVVTRLEVDRLKDIAYEIDEKAFVTINPVHEIVGGRFKQKGH